MRLFDRFIKLIKSSLSLNEQPKDTTNQTVVASDASTVSDINQISGEIVIIYADGRQEPFDSSTVRQQYLQAIVNSERFSQWANEQYIQEQARLVRLDVEPQPSSVISNRQAYPGTQSIDILVQLQEVLERDKQALILGELGIGKSTLMEKLTYRYAQKALQGGSQVPLPVYVPLNRFTGDLWECLRSTLNEIGQLDLTRDQIETLLSHVTCLMLFDGVNELGRRKEEGIRAIRNFSGIYHQHTFIFTCRTYEYRNELNLDTAIEIEHLQTRGVLNHLSLKLGNDQGQQLYRRIVTDNQLNHLASNPLLLNMIVKISEEQQGDLPRNRGQLLKQFVEKLLWREVDRHQIPIETRKRALASLACTMHHEHVDQYHEQHVMECFTSFLERWRESFNWRDLLNALRADDLLRSSNERWFYRHIAFQEYFTAVEIESQMEDLDTILDYLEDQWWHQVILFIVGITSERDELINAITESDPFLAHRAVMSCDDTEILMETREFVSEMLIEWALTNAANDLPQEVAEALEQLGEATLAPLVRASVEDEMNIVLDWTIDIVMNFPEITQQVLLSKLPQAPILERRVIAYILGRVGDENVVKSLIPLLNDESPNVVAETIQALGYLGAEQALDQLQTIIERDERETEDGIPLANLATEALNEIHQRLLSVQRVTPNTKH